MNKEQKAATVAAMLTAAKNASFAVISSNSLLNAMSIAILVAVKAHPKDADGIIARAKGEEGYAYDGGTDQSKASWRTAAKYLNRIIKDAAMMDRVIKGDLLPSQAYKELTAPEQEARKAEKEAEAAKEAEAKAEHEAQEADRLRSEGRQLITPAEMVVYAARWLDEQSLASLSPAEAKAVDALLASIEGFKARSVEQVAKAA